MTRKLRDWVCSCGCTFTAEVVLSDKTQNISGEATIWCPVCNKKPLMGSPPYEEEIDDKRLEQLEKDPLDRSALQAIVAGALRDTIRAHGPITKSVIGSAAKRVVGIVISVFKQQAKDAIAKSAHTLVMREDEEEFKRLKNKNNRLRKIVHDLLEKCRNAGLLPIEESHDDRDEED